ncbi:hypothetical protein [Streptomyces sp. NPDC101237]|uniref:hypothetical protein n=1 Tax=Streptomyces sp. NPDC101237 TaxID=3366139 RepID=UPI0038115716
MLYQVRESFADAQSALARARAIMRDLAVWHRIVGDREPDVVPFLDELGRRGVVVFDAEQRYSRLFTADLRLGPDLWPISGSRLKA